MFEPHSLLGRATLQRRRSRPTLRGSPIDQDLSENVLRLLASCFGPGPQEAAPTSSVRAAVAHAFETGLVREFPAPLGALLAAAVSYCREAALDRRQLQELVDLDSSVILRSLFQNTTDGTTMRFIHSAMVGSALLGDTYAVKQWAQEGLTRFARVGGDWSTTGPEWKWVRANSASYSHHIQELRRFVSYRQLS